MRWSNVLTIFRREVRDQLRDRRTLFMIFVLPILLYPVLGFGMVQLSLAFRQTPRTVVVVGAENLPAEPPLLDPAGTGFAPGLDDAPGGSGPLLIRQEGAASAWADPDRRREAIRGGAVDAVLIVPPDLRDRLAADRPESLEVIHDGSDDRGRSTYLRVRDVLDAWRDRVVRGRLARDKKPESYTRPFAVTARDVATRAEAGASNWARIFPFLLVLMSLTGAFYPAIDLCAGEKERGTMETLLISPASRGEIVAGKFLTVVLASMATAFLNLASMALTGWKLANDLGRFGAGGPHTDGAAPAAAVLTPPSLEAAVWMGLLLVPLSAFFAALCLALAVLARSMKEGQYYMTPLYLTALPLIFATLAPGIQLDAFTSLVPITGVSLLLRALMQGHYAEARVYALPVLLPIVLYGALALRWAVDQFRRESVLFREGERVDVAGYLRHLMRDKAETPNGGQAVLCFALMMAATWFLMGSVGQHVAGLIEGQFAFILGPPVLLALLLTARPGRTLRLAWPGWGPLALAAGLALAIHPVVAELRRVVEAIFPTPELAKTQLGGLLEALQKNLWVGLLAIAVVPALCEEVAFRGFILSGLEREYRPITAIVLTACLFGLLHVLISLFQQLFNATLLGVVLGLLAVRSRSLWPGVVFHAINNGLALILSRLGAGSAGPWIERLYRDPAQALYRWPVVAVGGGIAAILLAVLVRDRRGAAKVDDDPALDLGLG